MKQVICNSYPWFTRGAVRACGYCYDADGHLFAGERLCDYFSGCADADELARRALAANGLFAVVIESGQQLLAATDRLRRYPLFYTDDGTLSDSHHPLSASSEWDEMGKAFYQSSGAVLPGHTLLRDVHQLPPASVACHTADGWIIKPYASFLCAPGEQKDCNVDELDQTMLLVFKRLIDSISGRQIVVPLTAGNDSRLILCMLRRLGYSNLVCYTVEGIGGHEFAGAHEAATKLGYPHHKIDMTDARIRQLCYADADDFEQYYRYMGSLTNFCWLYDFVAVKYLKKQELIAADAVFVPGHSGDMIAGSHLCKARVQENATVRELVRRMLYVGFEYQPQRVVRETLTEYFRTAVQAGYSSYSAYQNWVVQHRQAHNILNSIRVYDYCGYDVRLPLWDNALYDLFARLPYSALADCRLYRDYVAQVFAPFGLCVAAIPSGVSWSATACRKLLKQLLPDSILRRCRTNYDPVGEGLLSRTLGEELGNCLGHEHTCTNSNELLLQWYLMRVSQGRA